MRNAVVDAEQSLTTQLGGSPEAGHWQGWVRSMLSWMVWSFPVCIWNLSLCVTDSSQWEYAAQEQPAYRGGGLRKGRASVPSGCMFLLSALQTQQPGSSSDEKLRDSYTNITFHWALPEPVQSVCRGSSMGTPVSQALFQLAPLCPFMEPPSGPSTWVLPKTWRE